MKSGHAFPHVDVVSSMAEKSEATAHVQAVFFTKDQTNAVPDTPFSLPVSASRDDLSHLISQLLEREGKEFDFLIGGALLRNQLERVIEQLQINTENVVQIEYVERSPPPSLSAEFSHNDWLSAVHCTEQFILTGCYDNSIQIWSHSGELLASSSMHQSSVTDAAWLPSADSSAGQLYFLSASQDQNVHIWKLDTYTLRVSLLHVCKGHAQSVEAITVNPEGSKFCSVGWDRLVKVWETGTGCTEECSQLSAPEDKLEEGKEEDEEEESAPKRPRLSSTDLRPITRTPLVTLAGHTHPVTTATWPVEEEFLTAGYDHCIRVWDTPTGINKNTLNGSKVFLNIDKQREGHLIVSGHTDRHVRIWDTRNSVDVSVTCILSSHRGWVKAVRWSPSSEHQLVSGCYDNTVKLWDIRSPKTPLYTIAAHEDKVMCMDWSLSKVLATGGADNHLRIYTF